MFPMLLSLLAAAPRIGVVVSFPGHAGQERDATRHVLDALDGASEFAAQRPAAVKCGGEPSCLGAIARELGAEALVVAELSQAADVTVGQFEAVSAAGARLASGDFTSTGPRWTEALDGALATFAQRLSQSLPASPSVTAPAPAEAPGPEVASPEPPAPSVVAEPAPTRDRPAARWLPLVGGVALLASGSGCLAASQGVAAQLKQRTFDDAATPARLAAEGSTQQAVGVALLAAGAVVTVGGALLALLWPEAQVTPAVALVPGGALLGVRAGLP